jgi:hypothetical protein
MRAHHDQVALHFTGGAQNLFGRIALFEPKDDGRRQILAFVTTQLLLQLVVIPVLLPAGHDFAIRDWRGIDMQNHQRGAVVARKRAGHLESVVGRFRKIRGVKNGPNGQHGVLL